jgi:hypothetical protein
MEDDMSYLNRLRCYLRAVNIEYSTLVGRKAREATANARMAELRAERHVLMALIAIERQAVEKENALEHALSTQLRVA